MGKSDICGACADTSASRKPEACAIHFGRRMYCTNHGELDPGSSRGGSVCGADDRSYTLARSRKSKRSLGLLSCAKKKAWEQTLMYFPVTRMVFQLHDIVD